MKGYWNNLRPFEKRVFVGVMSMLFIVFNFWFVRPHFSDWAKVQKRMAAAQKKLANFRDEIAKKSHYEGEVRRLEGEGLAVPPEDQSVQFMRAIQNQAQQSRVNVLTYGRQAYRTNQFFLELSMNISSLSGEGELVDFLYNLGAGTSLIRVRDLTLKPDVPRQQLTSQIKLVASYQKKPATRGTAAQPSGRSPAPAKSTPATKSTPPPKTPPSAKTNASPAKSPESTKKTTPAPVPSGKAAAQTNQPAVPTPKKP